MSAVTNYEEFLLKGDVKRTFEANYIKMLFEKHRDLPKGDILDFLHKAQLSGANPALNQIFLIERNTKIGFEWRKVGTVVFSYNFLLAVANQSGGFEGYETSIGMIDKFDINTFEAKKMLACTTVVKRNGNKFPYTAYFDEFVQIKDGKATGQWASKPYLMLEKCSLSGALRRACPEALSAMYCAEEMESVSNEFDKAIETQTAEIKAVQQIAKFETIIEKAKPESIAEVNSIIESIREQLGVLTSGASASDKARAMSDICGVSKFADIKSKSIDELKAMLSKMNGIIKEKEEREIAKASKPSFKLGE